MEPSVILSAEQASKLPLPPAGNAAEKRATADTAEDTLIADDFAALVSNKTDTPAIVSTLPGNIENSVDLAPLVDNPANVSVPATHSHGLEHTFIPSTSEGALPKNALPAATQPIPVLQGQASPSPQGTNIVEITPELQTTPLKVAAPLGSIPEGGLITTLAHTELNNSSIHQASSDKPADLTNFPLQSLPREATEAGKLSVQHTAVQTLDATGNTTNFYISAENTSQSSLQVALPPVNATAQDATVTAPPANATTIPHSLPDITTQTNLQPGLSLQNIEISEATPSTTITQQALSPTPISPATAPQIMTPGATQPAIQQVVLAIQTQPQTSSGDIEIRLDPPELGNVRIKFNFDIQGQVQAHIFAENSDTTALLRRHMDILARELTGNGFEGANIHFDKNDEQSHQENDAQKQSGRTVLSWEDNQSVSQVGSKSVQTPYANIGSLSHLNIIL